MKKLTILEYCCIVIAIITVLFVMALVNADRFTMREALKIAYMSLTPLMVVRIFYRRDKYFIGTMLYFALLVIYFIKKG